MNAQNLSNAEILVLKTMAHEMLKYQLTGLEVGLRGCMKADEVLKPRYSDAPIMSASKFAKTVAQLSKKGLIRNSEEQEPGLYDYALLVFTIKGIALCERLSTKRQPFDLVDGLGAVFMDSKMSKSVLEYVISQGVSAKEFWKEFDRRVRASRKAIEADY